MKKRFAWAALLLTIFCVIAVPVAAAEETDATAQSKAAEVSLTIPRDAKIYVASMPDNFDENLKEAIASKKVPATLVDNRDQADFEITGYSETQKAGAAKIIVM